MKTMFKSFSMLAVAACAGMSIVSCTSDKDLYDPSVVEQKAKAEYEANFVKKFGSVAGINWDLSEAGVMTTIEGYKNTRAVPFKPVEGVTYVDCTTTDGYLNDNYPYLNNGWYNVPSDMQTKLNVMQEDHNNKKYGLVWAMSIPDNNFTIIPVRQGSSNEPFELHMVVGTGDNAVDYTVWKKGGFIQRSPIGKNQWTSVSGSMAAGTTAGNYDVRSKALTFRDLPKDEPLFFYLFRSNSGEYPSSLEGYMMDITETTDIPADMKQDGKQVRVIGAEARWNKSQTDWDYEDVVFMIVGDPSTPEDIDPEGLRFKQTIAKRYMIEDLGMSDDTDFNDMVVDVEKYRYMSVVLDRNNGQVLEREFSDWAEDAVLRHKGGTLPFQLTIGNTTFDWMDGEMNIDPNMPLTGISGWDPDQNNISVKVQQKDGEKEGYYTIEFPETGSVPLMVATKTREPWSAERVSFLDKVKEIINSLKNLVTE